jgi:ATP-dependent DNA ligase
VFKVFREIARTEGGKSQERKKGLITKLLVAARGVEPKYIIRMLQVGSQFGTKSAAANFFKSCGAECLSPKRHFLQKPAQELHARAQSSCGAAVRALSREGRKDAVRMLCTFASGAFCAVAPGCCIRC